MVATVPRAAHLVATKAQRATAAKTMEPIYKKLQDKAWGKDLVKAIEAHVTEISELVARLHAAWSKGTADLRVDPDSVDVDAINSEKALVEAALTSLEEDYLKDAKALK